MSRWKIIPSDQISEEQLGPLNIKFNIVLKNKKKLNFTLFIISGDINIHVPIPFVSVLDFSILNSRAIP
jgi:hypothetical protein